MSRSRPYNYQASPENKRKLIAFMIISFIVWSLALMLLYMVADSLINWVTTGGGALIDAGKSLAGKEATTVFETLNLTQFTGPAIALLRASLGPVLWVVWALGVVIILFLPAMFKQLQSIRKMRGH
ncbi:hypothetical protein [Ochrobactrum sp. SFR4]|uniref:hypothetical protein n=1 Tax=Ochrobactrum sp. SFR4 TaxID=2717368 RepID=UPI001C8C0A9A|nr:hypothetical protein [Ochrobactrum sp. SFR4]MBX8825861.1 hypothetical protein [Ochrobactrum sp. SFR4]